jgi:hypothetical protein
MKYSRWLRPSRSDTVLSCPFFGAVERTKAGEELLKLGMAIATALVLLYYGKCTLVAVSFYYRHIIPYRINNLLCDWLTTFEATLWNPKMSIILERSY